MKSIKYFKRVFAFLVCLAILIPVISGLVLINSPKKSNNYLNAEQVKIPKGKMSYSVQKNDLLDKIILDTLYTYLDPNVERVISKKKLLNDFDGNEFILYEFLPTGYLIYNPQNGDAVEIGCNSQSPFYGQQGELFYSTLNGYYYKENNIFYDKYLNFKLNAEDLYALQQASKKNREASLEHCNTEVLNALSSSDYTFIKNRKSVVNDDGGASGGVSANGVKADKEVKYSWYFRNNKTQFANGSGPFESGSCGFRALSLVLVYHELFSSAGYFSSEEAYNFINTAFASPNLLVEVPVIEDSIINYLVNLKSSAYQTHNFLKGLAEEFLKNKNISYEHGSKFFYRDSEIRDLIDESVPVILCGNLDSLDNNGAKMSHDVVIYGYYSTKGKYLTHYGWENKSDIILTNYALCGIYYLKNKSPHVHNKYYSYSGRRWCACGALVS